MCPSSDDDRRALVCVETCGRTSSETVCAFVCVCTTTSVRQCCHVKHTCIYNTHHAYLSPRLRYYSNMGKRCVPSELVGFNIGGVVRLVGSAAANPKSSAFVLNSTQLCAVRTADKRRPLQCQIRTHIQMPHTVPEEHNNAPSI